MLKTRQIILSYFSADCNMKGIQFSEINSFYDFKMCVSIYKFIEA